jgi:hypothetical protein
MKTRMNRLNRSSRPFPFLLSFFYRLTRLKADESGWTDGMCVCGSGV